jgi:hypothetical protein
MIPPRAIALVIRHLDAIDRAVSARMSRKRPWLEPSLTSLLCDLLDSETQEVERLAYPLQQLNQDLAAQDGLVSIAFQIQTHEYAPQMERWVSQADLGLVITITDYLLPFEEWRLSWLLQAKRLRPNRSGTLYSEASRFGGMDARQHERLLRLASVVDVPFIKYLLYCPRPSGVDPVTEKKLAHLRNRALADVIFDHVLGLHLHEELGRLDSSLAAGVLVSSPEGLPANLGKAHAGMLEPVCPLSWFLARHLLPSADNFSLADDRDPSGSP